MRTVLILEDETIIALHLEHKFREAGMRVVGMASTPLKAISLATIHKPDLLLVDVRLRDFDGIEIAEQILQLHGCDIIVASGSADSETIARAEALDPVAIIRKPYDPAQVISRIEAHWASEESPSIALNRRQ